MKTKTIGQKVKTTAHNICHANENARKRERAERTVKILSISSLLAVAGTAVTSHIIAKHHYNKIKNAPDIDLDDLEDRILKVEKDVESFGDTVTFDEGERSLDD